VSFVRPFILFVAPARFLQRKKYDTGKHVMLVVKYFADLRERLGCSEQQLPWQQQLQTVAELKQFLVQSNTDFQGPLSDAAVLVAVNQIIADEQTPLSDGDEVAFFPPVTGG
jgi:molybdopterin converting factor subunit 1